jgi:hypothetical protein
MLRPKSSDYVFPPVHSNLKHIGVIATHKDTQTHTDYQQNI